MIPPLRLATDLIARGHQVSMIVPEAFATSVRAHGIMPVCWRDPRYERAYSLTRSAGDTAAFAAGERVLTACVADNTERGRLRDLLDSGHYDLVIADEQIPATAVLAWSLGIPCIQTADSLPVGCLPMTPDRDERIRAAIAQAAEDARIYRQNNPAVASFAEFRKISGYPAAWIDESDPCAGRRLETALGNPLLLCPPTLSIAPPIRERFHFCQSLPEPAPDQPRPRARESRLIALSFGNHAARYPHAPRVARCLIEAMSDIAELEMIVLAFPPALAETLSRPPNVRFVGFVDQRALLREGVRLMCTHGGLGTAKECVYAGTPMLVTPFGFDQPRNATAMEFLGVASRVAPTAPDDVLRARFLAALRCRDLQERAASVSASVRDFERRHTGADVVEAALQASQPPTRA